MRFFFIMLLLILGVGELSCAQSDTTKVNCVPNLILTRDARFVTQDGSEHFIIEYPGLTAHEIYQRLNTNIVKTFASAKDVLNRVEDRTISIRAWSNELIYCVDGLAMLSGNTSVKGYFRIEIDIKDGKARISTPEVEVEKSQMFGNIRSFPFVVADNYEVEVPKEVKRNNPIEDMSPKKRAEYEEKVEKRKKRAEKINTNRKACLVIAAQQMTDLLNSIVNINSSDENW